MNVCMCTYIHVHDTLVASMCVKVYNKRNIVHCMVTYLRFACVLLSVCVHQDTCEQNYLRPTPKF